MPDTDKSAVRQQVAEAREAVGKVRNLPNLTASEKECIDDTYRVLRAVEKTLTLAILTEHIDNLAMSSGQMADLAKTMKGSVEDLQDAAALVAMAAVGLGALADAASKAASGGTVPG
jgi:hypothetical protein